MHGCIFNIVATDALVLKHQAISIHSADLIVIALEQCHTEILQLDEMILENIIIFEKNYPV